LFIQQQALFYLLPPFLLVATITGWLNGVAAQYITDHLRSAMDSTSEPLTGTAHG